MRYQEAETLIFIGEERSGLRYQRIKPGSLTLWACSRQGQLTAPYREGVDYRADYETGQVWRCGQSAIGDYRSSVFFGCDPFDHTEHDDYGNYAYMVYASYLHDDEAAGPMEVALSQHLMTPQAGLPRRIIERITAGERIRYCVFGDSISTGGEAVPAEMAYFHRFAALLRRLGARVELEMHAIGGETSEDGMRRFEAEILPLQADLVTIAYGMNDQNRARPMPARGEEGAGEHFVSPERYAQNIHHMALALQSQGSAVTLISPCEPNPRWRYASGRMSAYCSRLRELSLALHIPLADANALWHAELASGKRPEDLLLNDINHPTSYGHYLYYCAMAALL